MKTQQKLFYIVLFLFCTALAFGGTIKNYSADQVDVESNRVMGKLYAADSKFRMEMYDENGNIESFIIVRQDQKKMYTFQADGKTYMEFPITGSNTSIYDSITSIGQGIGIIPEIKREKEGNETVGGYNTEKFRTTTTIEFFGQKQTTTVYEWIAAEFDLPVRTQTDDITIEMRNIATTAQAASLFEIPSGYSLMGNFMDLLQIFGQ